MTQTATESRAGFCCSIVSTATIDPAAAVSLLLFVPLESLGSSIGAIASGAVRGLSWKHGGDGCGAR